MTRGALTLVFDDGYRSVFDRVLPLLRGYGLRAVFAVPVETAGLAGPFGEPVAPLAEWKTVCATHRHELAAHGVAHRALPSLADRELEEELRRSREATGATTLVYPGGAHDDRAVALVRRHFRAARTVRAGWETIPPRDPYRLRSFVARSDNFRVWKWNLRVLTAWLTNRWIIETYHQVVTDESGPGRLDAPRHAVPLEALERHLRFIRRLPIRVVTIREVIHAGVS